jgi:hypothetical protein
MVVDSHRTDARSFPEPPDETGAESRIHPALTAKMLIFHDDVASMQHGFAGLVPPIKRLERAPWLARKPDSRDHCFQSQKRARRSERALAVPVGRAFTSPGTSD